jgi:uncharacterized membrane protein YhaH (DUF805 family)
MAPFKNLSSEASSHRPGIGRAAYFGFSLLFVLISGIVEVASGAESGTALGVLLVLLVVGLFLGGSRYISIGYSPWLILLGLIPIINLFITYQCFALPPGFAKSKTWDLPMKIVTGLYVAFAGLLLLAIIGAM